jgi:MGT family glycosyltransferase
LTELARSYAERVGLKIDWNDPAATVSKLAVITQTPKEFDFPGIPWPARFHYAGPFHDDEDREPVSFPWEQLTDKPLIYASLGTLVNGMDNLYKHVLKAVEPLEGIQVVLSVGKNVNPDNLDPVPSNTIVVRSAPQIDLLKRAALCITHAGLNTTLESLAHGVPIVAIPIGYDQPGTAARIAHHGTGEFIEVDELTPDRLRCLIETVLQDPSYRERADYFRKVISKTRGLDVAADIIEQAFQNRQSEVPSVNGSVARGGPKRAEEMQEAQLTFSPASSYKRDKWNDSGPWYEGHVGASSLQSGRYLALGVFVLTLCTFGTSCWGRSSR